VSGPKFLRLRRVSDAIVVPRPDHLDRSAGAGVVPRRADSWEVVPDTGVRRRGRQYVEPPPTEDLQPTRHLDAAVFAGFVYAHYGHFLLESLGRLWFDEIESDLPLLWLAATTDRFDPWMSDMLDLVGIGPNRHLVTGAHGPVQVDELLVADQGFEVQRYLHPWFAGRLEAVAARPADPGLRVWLSRSGLGDRSGFDCEPDIEAELERRGWLTVRPEELTIREQAELLAKATSVAAIEGSALHTLLLVRGFEGSIDLVTRHNSTSFEVIARAKGWDQVRHEPPGATPTEWHRPSGARDVRWSNVDPRAVAAIVDRSSGRPRGRSAPFHRLSRTLQRGRGRLSSRRKG
jgi:hypothetical protein